PCFPPSSITRDDSLSSPLPTALPFSLVFNSPAPSPSHTYPLSLHDALPICVRIPDPGTQAFCPACHSLQEVVFRSPDMFYRRYCHVYIFYCFFLFPQ